MGLPPDYLKNHPIYYAGPAKTPDQGACFDPQSASRLFMKTFQQTPNASWFDIIFFARCSVKKNALCHKYAKEGRVIKLLELFCSLRQEADSGSSQGKNIYNIFSFVTFCFILCITVRHNFLMGGATDGSVYRVGTR